MHPCSFCASRGHAVAARSPRTLGITYPIRGSRMNLGARFKTFGLGLRVASKFLATSPQALATPWRFLLHFAAPRGITCLGSRATDTMVLMRQRQRPNHQASGLRDSERARPAASAGRASRSVLSVNFGARCSIRRLARTWRKAFSSSVTFPVHAAVMPNPLVNRTLHGMPALGIISFLPKPATPFRAGYRERYASAKTCCAFSAVGLRRGSR
jgi:hypothetical protein